MVDQGFHEDLDAWRLLGHEYGLRHLPGRARIVDLALTFLVTNEFEMNVDPLSGLFGQTLKFQRFPRM